MDTKLNSVSLIDRVKRAMLGMQRYPWEQGVAAQALLELGDTENLITLAVEAVHRQWDDGRLSGIGEIHPVTDPAANGEPVLAANRLTNDPIFATAAEKMLDYLLNKAPHTKDGTIHHVTNAPQLWVDSMYMCPPFLAAAGHSDEAARQLLGMTRILWDQQQHLFSHIWDEDKKDFVRKDHWGVGNGWAIAGLARVIDMLPESMSNEKQQLIEIAVKTIDACLGYLREDGLLHDVIDNPATFVETNLSQMLAYSIYRGIASRWLPVEYRLKADQMRAAAHAKVDRYGLVRDVCGAPNFDRPGTAVEGQAFFLLMESAFAKLG